MRDGRQPVRGSRRPRLRPRPPPLDRPPARQTPARARTPAARPGAVARHGKAAERAGGTMRALLRGLGLTPDSFAPIASGECGHQHAEDRYTPSRKLKHLIRARAQTCTGPGCGAQSFHADQDHLIPYPAGPTDECNLHAPCRAHHRAKQAPGWHAEQPNQASSAGGCPTAAPTSPAPPSTTANGDC